MSLEGNTIAEDAVFAGAGILCQGEKHQRGKGLGALFLFHQFFQRSNILLCCGGGPQEGGVPLRQVHGGAVRHFGEVCRGVVERFPGCVIRRGSQQVTHDESFHFRGQRGGGGLNLL